MLQRQLTAHNSQSKERNMKKIRLEALSNKQKTSESSLDVDLNTENFEKYWDEKKFTMHDKF